VIDAISLPVRSRVTYEAYVVSGTSTRPQVDSAGGDCAWARWPGQLRVTRAAGIAAVCGRVELLVFVLVFAGDTQSDVLEPLAQCSWALPTTSAPKTRRLTGARAALRARPLATRLPPRCRTCRAWGPRGTARGPLVSRRPAMSTPPRSSSTAAGLSRASRVNPAGDVEGHPNDPHRKRARGRI
jgi:hypothetical protein